MKDRKWQVEIVHENGVSYGFEVGSIRKIGKLIQSANGEIASIKMNNTSVEINGTVFKGSASDQK